MKMNRVDKYLNKTLKKDFYAVDNCIEFVDTYPDIWEYKYDHEFIERIYGTWFLFNVGYKWGIEQTLELVIEGLGNGNITKKSPRKKKHKKSSVHP